MIKVGDTFDVYETLTDGGYIKQKGKWGIDLGTHTSPNLVNLMIDKNHREGLPFGLKTCFTGRECRKVAVLRITKINQLKESL